MFEVLLYSGLILGISIGSLLLLKSLLDFSHTGPVIRDEILRHYRWYSVFSLLRLTSWSVLIITWLAWIGGALYIAFNISMGTSLNLVSVLIASLVWVVAICSLQFSSHLLYIPSSLMMSSNYKMTRFYKLWSCLTVTRLRWARLILYTIGTYILVSGMMALFIQQDWESLVYLSVVSLILLMPWFYAIFPEINFCVSGSKNETGKFNILMIGSDTLRVDRFGATGYPRGTTPFLDAIAKQGKLFVNCYTPIARTAPSVASLLTGVWPQKHGIRTNFSSKGSFRPVCTSLPRILSDNGYETIAISDWSGSDFEKYDFGFHRVDAPQDQWNLKYLIRQGPKDMRLFLSLFTHNRFGKTFLPEIYYLAGIPLTRKLGKAARSWLSRFARNGKPFFLNIFMATTHPPFGSEYPYYTRLSDVDYRGESKFAMSRLVDPFDIIRSQKEPREAFDLDQITDLYDGCVRRFDDEVRHIMHHLRKCGLDNNTIVVIYSDHGMELFEHNTWGQGNSALGEASPRVPMMIICPGRTSSGIDHRVVRTVDLMPTLLDLCDIDQAPDIDGVSLAPYLSDLDLNMDLPAYFETGVWLARPPGQHNDHITYPEILELLDVPDRAVGTLVIKPEFQDIINEARDRMVRKGNWKLVRIPLHNDVIYQLFNLKSDPGCHNNVSGQYPEELARLKHCLSVWLKMENVYVR